MREASEGARSPDAATSAVLLVHVGDHTAALDHLAATLRTALGEAWAVLAAALGPASGSNAEVEAAVAEIAASGARTVVALSTSPHFDPGAGAHAFGVLYGALGRSTTPIALRGHPSWHDDAGYVAAVARGVAEVVSARGLSPEDTHLRFLAARPMGGDPRPPAYRARLRRTVELVAEHLGWPLDGTSLGYVTEVETREPDGRVLVCPLSPVAQPSHGGEGIHVCAPLSDSPPFVAALKRLVLKGTRPVPPSKRAPEPLLRTSRAPSGGEQREDGTRLVLLGASLRGVLESGAGPRVRHSDPHAFARAKKSHQDVGAFLEWVREATPVREALLWNTCQRSELYAWLPSSWDEEGRDALLGRLRRALFGSEPEGLAVTVLHGAQARHHLLRTACGLNSDLPGDRDVAAQLLAALRRAQSAGTAAAGALEVVEDAVSLVRDVNAHTTFGRFSIGYCAAALTRVCEADGLLPASLRHATIGGSTTSRSVLQALRADHHVPTAQLTAVYREHHGQMKQLRAALGSGRRLRVHSYADERVLCTIADTDVVYLGIDQADPVLEARSLAGLRDFRVRPLTLVDFNAFGSLGASAAPEGVRIWSAAEIDDAVAAHAAITTSRSGFAAALGEAEAWIARHVAGRDETVPRERSARRGAGV
jgi:glutamyl-tRNA reductase